MTGREERAEGPGEGAEDRCCSGRVVSVVEMIPPAAPSDDSWGNSQSLTAALDQSGGPICGLKSGIRLSRLLIHHLFLNPVLLTFITLRHTV